MTAKRRKKAKKSQQPSKAERAEALELLLRAREMCSRKDWSAAEECCTRAIALVPGDAAALTARATVYARKALSTSDATEYRVTLRLLHDDVQKACDLEPGDRRAALFLLEAKICCGRPGEAAAFAREIWENLGPEAGTRYEKGVCAWLGAVASVLGGLPDHEWEQFRSQLHLTRRAIEDRRWTVDNIEKYLTECAAGDVPSDSVEKAMDVHVLATGAQSHAGSAGRHVASESRQPDEETGESWRPREENEPDDLELSHALRELDLVRIMEIARIRPHHTPGDRLALLQVLFNRIPDGKLRDRLEDLSNIIALNPELVQGAKELLAELRRRLTDVMGPYAPDYAGAEHVVLGYLKEPEAYRGQWGPPVLPPCNFLVAFCTKCIDYFLSSVTMSPMSIRASSVGTSSFYGGLVNCKHCKGTGTVGFKRCTCAVNFDVPPAAKVGWLCRFVNASGQAVYWVKIGSIT